MTRKLTLLAVVPALVLGLSACGSSGEDAGSSPSSASSMPMPMPSSSTGSPSSAGSPSSSADSAESVIAINDFAYEVPASVAPGATITVKNGDSQAHTVTSKEGGFDVKVDPNGTATVTAPSRPGRYPFVCTFHANMTGTLVVR